MIDGFFCSHHFPQSPEQIKDERRNIYFKGEADRWEFIINIILRRDLQWAKEIAHISYTYPDI